MPSPPRYPSRCIERFLHYVTYDTQSEEGQETFPSTAKQLILMQRLAEELGEMGLTDVVLDEHGYVFATVPPNTDKADVPTIGFVAHVDTSPEISGAGVRPILHENYQGQDLVLPNGDEVVLRPSDSPHLKDQIGNTIITASGDTLLGADNKAGVAEIMGAVEVWLRETSLRHGAVRIAFTPDEEIGQGARYFDVERFGARCAYTVDGETLGEYQDETFSADSATFTFHGVNTHPGYAKGGMVNALKVAAEFLSALPSDAISPETTEGKEGFVHPYVQDGGVDACRVRMLVRSFDTEELEALEERLKKAAEQAVSRYPGSRFEMKIEASYRNMKEVLDRHPDVVDYARQGIERAGLTPRKVAIRGGTDGSRLCFMGLPTPNIFAGEHNFHSRLEWVSVEDMHKAVETIVEIAGLWEENA